MPKSWRNSSRTIRSACLTTRSAGPGAMQAGIGWWVTCGPRRWAPELHLAALAADRIPALHIGLVLLERLREHMAAGAVRHEVDRLRVLRIQHGCDAIAPRIGDRPKRQSRLAVGVVAGLRHQL